jgi:hypothetical protein
VASLLKQRGTVSEKVERLEVQWLQAQEEMERADSGA